MTIFGGDGADILRFFGADAVAEGIGGLRDPFALTAERALETARDATGPSTGL
jgi:hypothetical protein